GNDQTVRFHHRVGQGALGRLRIVEGHSVKRRNRVDRALGGHFTGDMTAHAVGDHEDRGAGEIVVLVPLAYPATVGRAVRGETQPGHLRTSTTTLPIPIWSPGQIGRAHV